MEFLYIFIGWMAGMFISSFTVIPILIIFVFGIPVTKKLERLDLINGDNNIIKRYMISVAVLSAILAGSLFAVYSFFPSLTTGFFIGMVMTLVLGLGKVGRNTNNISDYIQTNQNHFKSTPEEIASAM